MAPARRSGFAWIDDGIGFVENQCMKAG